MEIRTRPFAMICSLCFALGAVLTLSVSGVGGKIDVTIFGQHVAINMEYRDGYQEGRGYQYQQDMKVARDG